jgi:hypothetical protein
VDSSLKKGFAILILGAVLLGLQTWRSPVPAFYDIIVFGGGFGGCAAAISAASVAPEKSVLLVMPEAAPGGLGTVGGQNFFDLRLWRGELVSGGLFAHWFGQLGQFYNTESAAGLLRTELAALENITVLYGRDLESVRMSGNMINALILREVVRAEDGGIAWGENTEMVRGQVFVDASEDGRLTRLTGAFLVSGRSDWPQELLPSDEQGGLARQQAATLMFKVRGVAVPSRPGRFGDMVFTQDNLGSWGIWGGREAYTDDRVITAFNRVYGPEGFAIKPFNIAQNGAGSDEWWVNMLLIFDVDGRANRRDAGTGRFPGNKRPEQLDTDTAYIRARKFLSNPAFWQALRRFTYLDENSGQSFGLQEAVPVLDKDGQPVAGKGLYLRETVHLPEHGTAETLFPLTPVECQTAGSNPQKGGDLDNYADRIGLAFYAMDINAYGYADLLVNDRFVWPVTGYLRPDWQAAGGEPANPVYLPYAMLLTEAADNLLIPGYATGAASLAWAALRVLPNLTVLGEAAGVAAALAAEKKVRPQDFKDAEIALLQGILKERGALLEK